MHIKSKSKRGLDDDKNKNQDQDVEMLDEIGSMRNINLRKQPYLDNVEISKFNLNDNYNYDNICQAKFEDEEGKISKVKAFQIIEGVWIVPEGIKAYEDDSVDGVATVIRDENTMNTEEEQNIFLQSTIKLFERINTVDSGKVLLNLIKKSTPISLNNNLARGLTNNSIITIDATGKEVSKPCSVLIIRKKGSNDAFSTQTWDCDEKLENYFSILQYDPNIGITTERNINNERDITIIDPAITLYHELVHAMHFTYGLENSEIIDGLPVEEHNTFGSRSEPVRVIVRSNNDLLEIKIKELVNKINNNITSFNKEDVEYYANMYGLDINKEKTQVSFNKRIFEAERAIRYGCSELDFSKDLGIPTRDSYDDIHFLFLKIDVNNPAIYTIKGLVNGVKYERNSLPVHPDLKMKDNKGEYISYNDYIKLLDGSCNRAKRDLRIDKNCISLNPLDNDYKEQDKKTDRIIKKRETKCGVIDPIDLIETFNSKLHELPIKVLRDFGYENKNINHISSLKRNDHSNEYYLIEPKNIDKSKINIRKIIHYTNRSPVIKGLKKYRGKDIVDAHRFNNDLDYKTTPIEFVHNNMDLCVDCGNKSFTHNEKVSNKMDIATKGVNKALGAVQFIDWANTLINDFKDDTRPEKFHTPENDGLHMANDISTIVPYVGILSNIAVDLKDANYGSAISNVGIFLLLEAFPELLLPVMILGYLYSWAQESNRRDEMRETIKNNIVDILEQSNELIDINALSMEHTWANKVHSRVEVIAKNVVKQIEYNFKAIIHNTKYAMHTHYKLTESEQISLDEMLKEKEIEFEEHLDNVYIAISKTLFRELRKVFIEDYKKVSLNQMKSLTEGTKEEIKNILKMRDPALNDEFVNDCTNTMDNYIKQHDIGKKLDLQIKELQKLLDQEEKKLKLDARELIKVSVQGNKIVDVAGSNEVKTNKEIIVNDMQEGSYLLTTDKKNSIIIKNPIPGIRGIMSLGFWIKVPLTYTKKTESIKIIQLTNDLNVRISHGNTLVFKYLKNYKQTIDIPFNQWMHVFLSYKPHNQELSIYINGNKEKSLSSVNSFVSDKIIIGSLNSSYKDIFYYKISGFSCYCKSFSDAMVSNLYKKLKPDNLLYDITGSPLQTDKEYILLNSTYKNSIIEKDSYFMVNGKKQKQHNDIQSLVNREGLFVKINSLNKNKDKLITNGMNVNIISNNNNIGLYKGDNGGYVISAKNTSSQLINRNSVGRIAIGDVFGDLKLFDLEYNGAIGIATSINNSINGIISAWPKEYEFIGVKYNDRSKISNVYHNQYYSDSSLVNKIPNSMSLNTIPYSSLDENKVVYMDNIIFNFHPVDDNWEYSFWNFHAKK